ncbi:MAG: leucine-rich repeat domain-containing protein, partial [Odoribacteraceae bacterium]|nr:leucine-rich repeat domain-containing protein [Odoribacteraceae bacterium]
VTFPDGLECIGEGAFRGCTALENITVPGNVSVAPAAFEGCVNVKNITVEGNRLGPLLWLAPFFKEGRVNVTLSDDVKIIDEGAFRGCEFLKPIQIPEDTREIGKEAFAGLACMTRIAVPDSVTVIGEGAFAGCTGLKDVSFDRSRLQTIGDRAFAGCTRLAKIKIPDSVQSIGADAFDGCDNLKVIYIAPYSTTEKLYRKKKIAIRHPAVTFSHEDLERVEKSVHATITISPKARYIDEQAFRFYSGIKNVEIPGKVEHIGTGAFEGCAGLERVVFPGSVKYISSRAFKDCTGLANLVIPGTVEKINAEAFSGCTGIRELVFPVEALHGDGIFKGCSGLEKIIFSRPPASVPGRIRVPGETFMSCTGLESVTFPLADSVWIGANAFAGCTALKTVTFQYPAKKKHRDGMIMSDIFANTPLLERYNLEQERRSKGLCIHCGGKLNFLKTKCKTCGEKRRGE